MTKQQQKRLESIRSKASSLAIILRASTDYRITEHIAEVRFLFTLIDELERELAEKEGAISKLKTQLRMKSWEF